MDRRRRALEEVRCGQVQRQQSEIEMKKALKVKYYRGTLAIAAGLLLSFCISFV